MNLAISIKVPEIRFFLFFLAFIKSKEIGIKGLVWTSVVDTMIIPKQ